MRQTWLLALRAPKQQRIIQRNQWMLCSVLTLFLPMCCCLLSGTEFCYLGLCSHSTVWISSMAAQPTALQVFHPGYIRIKPICFLIQLYSHSHWFSQRWLVHMCVHMMDFHLLLGCEAADLGHVAQKPYSSSSCLKKMNLWVLCMPNPSVPVNLKPSSQAHFCICFLEKFLREVPNEKDLRQSPWPTPSTWCHLLSCSNLLGRRPESLQKVTLQSNVP